MDVTGSAGRVLLHRDIANITMNLNDMERVDINALGGADSIVVNDMTATDVKQVNINLSATLGGTAGDGQIDTVTVNGSNAGNTINITGQGGSIAVSGLAALVQITGSEAQRTGWSSTASAATTRSPPRRSTRPPQR